MVARQPVSLALSRSYTPVTDGPRGRPGPCRLFIAQRRVENAQQLVCGRDDRLLAAHARRQRPVDALEVRVVGVRSGKGTFGERQPQGGAPASRASRAALPRTLVVPPTQTAPGSQVSHLTEHLCGLQTDLRQDRVRTRPAILRPHELGLRLSSGCIPFLQESPVRSGPGSYRFRPCLQSGTVPGMPSARPTASGPIESYSKTRRSFRASILATSIPGTESNSASVRKSPCSLRWRRIAAASDRFSERRLSS